MISKNQKIYRLKGEHGHFPSEARVCIMALVGESEVPAHRYGVSMAISHLRPESV